MMLDRLEGNAELKSSVRLMLDSRRLTHSVLLVGEEGLGAGFAARCVAADYLYPQGGAPAEALVRGECCRAVAKAGKRDSGQIETGVVREAISVTGMGSGGKYLVGQVTAMRSEIFNTSLSAEGRAVLLYHVERMNEESANALLKVMEEPPEGVLFLLTADSLAGVLPTIRSRCISFAMAPVSPADCARYCTKEGVDAKAAALYSELFDGHIGTVLAAARDDARREQVEQALTLAKAAAAKEHWAWAMDDPAADDDKVPTKIKYTKVTRLIAPVFDILGTVPGYREYDISFWFLGFFTLFFAMIIGDAGYGCLFLLTAAALTVKSKKPSDAVQLLWVLSIATIVWGAMTGTWFGLEGAMAVPLLRSLVVPTFANYPEYFNVTTTQQQNSVMKFCFILGTVQLSLACVMNIRRKTREKDLSWVADLGWLCAICALYFVVLYLVIGEQVNLTPIAAVVLLGFVLVVCFGGMSPDKTFAQGLKAGLGNAFTVFLNTISAFGNIMSYIRLFAVGMASLAIAQSFNNMALGFKGPLVVVGILIMLVGHGLNIVMGLLSVVVHGVRLNLLEFSGQLGMEWTGTAYAPFKKLDKIRK